MANRPAPPLSVTGPERSALLALARDDSVGPRRATRARIVLAASQGTANERIAAQLGVTRMTVLHWRGRFERDRIAGLEDAPRPGRQPTYDQSDRDMVVALTIEPPPRRMRHWSARAISVRTGISATTIQRIWAEAGLRPHKTDPFRFTADRELVPRVRDVVGLYLAPPERAFVLSVGEPSVRQGRIGAPASEARPAFERPGARRYGTTHLYAALEAGSVKPRRIRASRGSTDFLDFLRIVERAYPVGELQVVLDNVTFHNSPAVRRWVESHPEAGFQFHLTPTSASWMNQIDAWFRLLSRQAIRRGSLRSVQDLTTMIASFSARWNEGSRPFCWVDGEDSPR